MFKILDFNPDTGEFKVATDHTELDEAKSMLKSRSLEKHPGILVYDRDENSEVAEDDENEIIMQVIEANNGNVLRVTKGVTVTKTAGSICCGAGTSCFCVVSPGYKGCETQYCNLVACWWVPCSIPCGC